jgi:hypothetical protein
MRADPAPFNILLGQNRNDSGHQTRIGPVVTHSNASDVSTVAVEPSLAGWQTRGSMLLVALRPMQQAGQRGWQGWQGLQDRRQGRRRPCLRCCGCSRASQDFTQRLCLSSYLWFSIKLQHS